MPTKPTIQSLIQAGVHIGHLTRKWNPKMHEYIFMENDDIHLIDLNKTLTQLKKVEFALKNLIRSGRKILFVATKKQAKDVVKQSAVSLGMPYVTERWLGGMLTNFSTIRKSLKKLSHIESQMKGNEFDSLAKRERLMIGRDKKKMEKLLGGISDLTRLPSALFVVDIKRERTAVLEAQKLNIPVFAMVDTNSDPSYVDFPIPANDDSLKSISIILQYVTELAQEGLQERAKRKEEQKEEKKVSRRKITEKGEKLQRVGR